MTSSYNCSRGAPYSNITEPTYMKEKSILYPVNVARNIAREAALTHFILPSDIELYPSPYLTPRFLNMIARNGKPLNVSTNPRVFPISIFEVDKNAVVSLRFDTNFLVTSDSSRLRASAHLFFKQ